MTVLLLLLLSFAQSPSSPTTLEYVVGAQDKLAITVFDEPSLTKTVTVDGDGSFDFPLIGRVRAAGLTVRAIQQDVTERLRKDYLVDPQVSIEVENYRSQVVYVTGQVRVPGAVPLMGNMTVMDALARAGSPLEDAGPYLVINRRGAGEGALKPEPERVRMEDLQSGQAQNIRLRDGDTIYVPKAETFFVTGYVRNPGPYLLDSVDLTVARAIAMAGGVTERGSRTRIRITRTVDGEPIVIKNVKPDDRVKPGDSIEVLQRLF